MALQSPTTALSPNRTAHRHPPNPVGDFPALVTHDSIAARTGSNHLTYAARVAASPMTEATDIILPIGTERTSPTKPTQTRLFGRDGTMIGRSENNDLEAILSHDPDDTSKDESVSVSSKDGIHLQHQSHWHRLQQTEQPPIPFQYPLPYGSHAQQPTFIEGVAGYLKKQQDELSLRHAEDLAAGRAQPSGEGGFHPPPGPTDPTNTTVFVGGLHHNVTEPELFRFFQPFGQISYVCLSPLSRSMRS